MKKFAFAAMIAIGCYACGSGGTKEEKTSSADFDNCNAHLKELAALYAKVDTTMSADTVYKDLPAKYTGKTFTLPVVDYKLLAFLQDTTKRAAMKSYGAFSTTGTTTCLSDKDYLDFAFWGKQQDDFFGKSLNEALEKQKKEDVTLVAVITPIDVEEPAIDADEFVGGTAQAYVDIFDYKTGDHYCGYFVYGENQESLQIPQSADAVKAKKFVVADLRSKLMMDVVDGLKTYAGVEGMIPIVKQ